MINVIKDVVSRHYPDNGQTNTYVSWYDEKGRYGCTAGKASNPHMLALLRRAEREGVPHRKETW